MKTKENGFKKFDDVKAILNKKTNLQVMYVKDLFRVSILACKNCKINTKTLKTFVFLPMLFFRAFRPLRVIYFVQSWSKVFFPQHISSFILYINTVF